MTETTALNQQWLDNAQYTVDAIRLYEKVYGEDFVSPGGCELSSELIRQLELEPGQRVLDAGCGLGSSSFLMADVYDVHVTGIDLSMNMLALARARLALKSLRGRVELKQKDCMTLTCSDTYDAIYSRDVFLHIADKLTLFSVLHRALKARGRLLFTDYACGPLPWHPDFHEYVDARGYQLQSAQGYTALLEQAGFQSVSVADRTEQFIGILQQDLQTIAGLDLERQAKQSLATSWQAKLERAMRGDHRWVVASARASSGQCGVNR
ncbi:MAG: methyltransferase domain-containing protein [Granulosicoccus sp.]|nr:methyltransferase domain-containing protein [Granulosicoccus sp.]